MSETLAAAPPRSWDDAPVRDLIEHVVAVHHRPLEKELPRLLTLSRRAARVHGRQAPCLEVLELLLRDLAEELASHVEKEEQILFPWILRSVGRGPGGPVAILEDEHAQIAVILDRIHRVTRDYAAVPHDCSSCRALVQGLRALDADLREHMRLEERVLFPRVLRGV